MADQLTGIHHIAIMSADIKKHIEFFSDVMGCELSALFHMHGVPGGLHAFLHLNDSCYFSIVQMNEAKDIPIEMGKTHSGTGANACAPGTMQHLAFNVDTLDDLLAMRDRLRGVLARMQEAEAAGAADRDHNHVARCKGCARRDACKQRL